MPASRRHALEPLVAHVLNLSRKNIVLFLWWLAFLAGGTYLLFATGLIDLFFDRRRLMEVIARYRSHAVVIFVALQSLQVVAAPVPGELTGFAGGVLFGPVWGVIYSTLGLTIGSWIAFMLARWMGRPLVEAVINVETMRRYDHMMKHKGLFLALLLFLIPGFPKDYLCYVLGLGHMRQRHFLAICVSGRFVGTVLLTLGGTYFRDERWHALFIVIGVSAALAMLAMIYRDRIEALVRRLQAAQRLRDMTRRRARVGRPPDPERAGRPPAR